jgi:hypothetical protein
MSVQNLLDYIGKYESRNDPNAVWGGIKKVDRPAQLVGMTVGGVLDWQDSIDARYMSEAAGEWQFMEDTLRGLYRQAGVALTDLFTRATQIKLATALLRRRGLDDYLAGRMTAEKFALSLSKEWASLPVPYDIERNGRTIKRGQSYYAGDGLNKAHADVDEFLAVIKSVVDTPAPEPRGSVAQTKTVKGLGAAGVGVVGAAGTAIGSLDGTAQIVLIGFLGVSALALGWLFRNRIKGWANGDR